MCVWIINGGGYNVKTDEMMQNKKSYDFSMTKREKKGSCGGI